MRDRLEAIYKLIPFSRKGIVDVGTDHGYIPVTLAENGFPGKLIATDINEKPLQNAIQYAKNKDVYNKIEFIKCDGLNDVDKNQIDTIIIAGMGGENIVGILNRDYWCASPEYLLILQPMSHSEMLRFWLINNEFRICNEMLVRDEGKTYQIIVAEYGVSEKYTDIELYTGKCQQLVVDPLYKEYLFNLKNKFETALNGLTNSNKDNGSLKGFYANIYSELNELIEDIEDDYSK